MIADFEKAFDRLSTDVYGGFEDTIPKGLYIQVIGMLKAVSESIGFFVMIPWTR